MFWNDFESFKNSAIQSKSSSLGVENQKILGIQPIYVLLVSYMIKMISVSIWNIILKPTLTKLSRLDSASNFKCLFLHNSICNEVRSVSCFLIVNFISLNSMAIEYSNSEISFWLFTSSGASKPCNIYIVGWI